MNGWECRSQLTFTVYGVCECKHDQHYTHGQAVSPSCNHPNDDGWPALSTGQRDAERARPSAALARILNLFQSVRSFVRLLVRGI